MKTKELMKNNFAGVCILILGIAILAETYHPGTIQRIGHDIQSMSKTK